MLCGGKRPEFVTDCKGCLLTPPEARVEELGTRSCADAQLVRAIGPWGVGANAVNSAVGGGIFVLPGLVAAILGPVAIFAYLVCGLAVALVLTCFIEIGSFVKRSGGVVAYVEEAFGPMMGFLTWVLYSVGFAVLACAALGAVIVDSMVPIAPALSHGAPRVIALLILFGGLAIVNIVGVRHGVRFAVVATIAKLLPLFFVIVAGLFVMHWNELRWAGWPAPGKLGEASLLLFFAFQGVEDALSPSGEIRDPARTVPRAMFGAMASLILLYVALQIVSQGVLGSELAMRPDAPLAAVAGQIIGTAGRTLLIVGAVVSIFGSLACGLLTTPRGFFLAAQNGMLPAVLTRVHPRFRTPHVAIMTTAALMFLLAVTGEFKPLVILSSVSTLCAYLLICLGALRLRYTRKREPGEFRAPGGPVVAVLGAATVLWLLASSTRGELVALGVAMAVAITYYVARRWMLLRSVTV